MLGFVCTEINAYSNTIKPNVRTNLADLNAQKDIEKFANMEQIASVKKTVNFSIPTRPSNPILTSNLILKI